MGKSNDKSGSLIIIVGSLLAGVSLFLPYLRYSFELEGLQELKMSYKLWKLSDMEQGFTLLTQMGRLTKAAPYIILIGAIIGIVTALMNIVWNNIPRITMAAAPILELIGFISISRSGAVREIAGYVKGFAAEMAIDGYTGSSGYGIAPYVLVAGIVISAAGFLKTAFSRH
jgi:hypothetical protein